MGKKLLLVSSNSSARGGGERYLIYLCEGLQKHGHQVHVLLSKIEYMDGWATALQAVGAQIHREALHGLRHRPLRFLQAINDHRQIRQIANFCRQISPDGVLVNQQYDEDGLDYLAGVLAANVAPVGGLMHMPMTRDKHLRPLGNWRGRILSRWYRQHPYQLILVSEGAQQEFEGYYPAPRPTKVVHHGVPFVDEAIEPAALPGHWNRHKPTIAFIGQLVEQKNPQLLLDSWQEANRLGADCQLLIVGDGPLRPAIETWLAQEKLTEACWLAGWQKQPEQFLPHIDLLVMTSHFEGFPLGLIEAAGHGIPAVVVDFNGAADIQKQASWVKVAPQRQVAAVGQTIFSALQDLDHLKSAAAEEQARFRAYFSVERMAQETLTALNLT